MKKGEVLAILISAIAAAMLLTGCTAKKTAAAEHPVIPEENPTWQAVSTAPEDFGIVYDDASMAELHGYPLDKLAVYLLGSDGVYAEAAHEEFYQRFMEAPDTVMSYLTLVDEQSRQTLCWAVASADAGWYKKTQQFQEILDTYSQLYEGDPKAGILEQIKELYQEME